MPLSLLALGAGMTGTAAAAKHSSPNGKHNISIATTPGTISSGDPLLIYGRLTGPNHGGRTVVIFHRIAGQSKFTPVQKTTTNAEGYYGATRAAGVVLTNRAWFARATGAQSRKVLEKVSANLSLDTPPTTALSNEPVKFTGHIAPAAQHVGDRVKLQSDSSPNGEGWRTIDGGKIQADGSYTITHRFKEIGSRSLRVVFSGDKYNTRDESDSFDLAVSQRQNPNVSLNQSAGSIKVGESVTLSGAVTGDTGGNAVTLYSRSYKTKYVPVATTTTGADGSYSFAQSPIRNTAYVVKASGKKHSAQVWIGVHDVVSGPVVSNATPQAGTPVTFTGSVSPDKTGHVLYLQKKGTDGNWHVVGISRVKAGSTYSITHVFGAPGDKVVRILVTGGPVNQRGVTDPVTISVAPYTPPTT